MIVVNQAFAERMWPGADPIGRVVSSNGVDFEVIGVAADSVVHDLYEPVPPFGYLLASQNYDTRMFLQVRMREPRPAAVTELRDELLTFDPRLPVTEAMPLADSLW